jgi:hypothetical protein
VLPLLPRLGGCEQCCLLLLLPPALGLLQSERLLHGSLQLVIFI